MERVAVKAPSVERPSTVISQKTQIGCFSKLATHVENLFPFSMSISKVCSGNLIKVASLIKAVSFPEQSLYLL